MHPLDATPAAELRATVDRELSQPDIDDAMIEILDTMEPGFAALDAVEAISPYIHWPSVVVILDAIEQAGLWPTIHAWREPPLSVQIGQGVLDVIDPAMLESMRPGCWWILDIK